MNQKTRIISLGFGARNGKFRIVRLGLVDVTLFVEPKFYAITEEQACRLFEESSIPPGITSATELWNLFKFSTPPTSPSPTEGVFHFSPTVSSLHTTYAIVKLVQFGVVRRIQKDKRTTRVLPHYSRSRRKKPEIV